MAFADVNGQHIYFEDSGGDGPAVIFSHGFLMDHEMFEPQVAALSGEFRCITWDERGFGQTEANGDFTYWDSADDALALLTHLGVERAFFVGMSQGGFLSMRAALRAPERVLGLGLIDTQSGPEPAEALPVYDAMTDEWMAKGPSDELAAAVASIILGDCDVAPWIAKWQASNKEAIGTPYRTLTGATTSPIACPRSPRPRSCSTAKPTPRSRWSAPSNSSTSCPTAKSSCASPAPATRRTSVTRTR